MQISGVLGDRLPSWLVVGMDKDSWSWNGNYCCSTHGLKCFIMKLLLDFNYPQPRLILSSVVYCKILFYKAIFCLILWAVVFCQQLPQARLVLFCCRLRV